jgi:hypothetical protein
MIDAAVIERISLWAVWAGITAAAAMTLTVIGGRVALAASEAHQKRLQRRYGPLVTRALAGDEGALRALVGSPPAHRLPIARILIIPLVDDRDPERISASRNIAQELSLLAIVDRYLRSYWWWRRKVALQVLGLIQARDYAAKIVGALDDPHPEVRNSALDALADLQDPETLKAIVVRMHDASLQRGRRAAALTAFGPRCEQFLLELARVDPEHRLNYARALSVCGTAHARPALCDWAADARVEVRSAVFEALGRIGLDDRGASLALAALESGDATERAMAAGALHGWNGGADAAARLGRHLDDVWTVAVQSARTLRSMGAAGQLELERHATGSGVASVLARQMLWEAGVRA